MKKIVVNFNIPNVGVKVYEQIWADLRAAGHSNPKGLIHHVGAPNGNDFFVTDVWESEEAFGQFGEVLMPIMAKNGIGDVTPTVLPLQYEYVGTTAAAR